MQAFHSGKLAYIFSLAVLSAAAVTPAQANYFANPNTGMNLNIGSAPDATPDDLSGAYPTMPRMMNEQGQVRLRLSLSEKGTVTNAVVDKSSGIPRLDSAAVEYAKIRWSYKPPNGQEMPPDMLLSVKFVLQ